MRDNFILVILLVLTLFTNCYADDVVKITWTANTEDDLSHYRIYQREKGTQDWMVVASNIDKQKTAYWLGDFERNSTFEWYVTAFDTSGNESSMSDIVEKTFLTNCCIGDLDNDGDVDGSDLSLFTCEFGRTNCLE